MRKKDHHTMKGEIFYFRQRDRPSLAMSIGSVYFHRDWLCLKFSWGVIY